MKDDATYVCDACGEEIVVPVDLSAGSSQEYVEDYAISFGMAGIYWSASHNMFRFIRRSSHELVWLTILFLAFISLLPFSTGLLARFHDDVTALVFYGGNLELIGFSLLWIWGSSEWSVLRS